MAALVITTGIRMPHVAARSQQPAQQPNQNPAPDSAQPPAAGQSDPASCKGVLHDQAALKAAVLGVTKYQKTYVLLVAGDARNSVTSATSPAIRDLSVEVNEDEAAAVAQSLQAEDVERTPATADSPVQPLEDLSAGKTQAVILWAPLAGAGMIDLGLEDKVAVYSVDRPRTSPAAFTQTQAASTAPNACAAAISDDLDSFGVLPAELLVTVHIRELFNTPTPAFSMQNAEQGGQVFNQVCARCHGANAVWDPALAPVDLLVSIRRFQFVGFKYIVMNGRPQKGMPPLRGTVSDDQIALIYQYLTARSKHQINPQASAHQ
jgi:cytochrome c553